MKLINQSAEYMPQSSGIEGIYKQIELAGRTSYLSWDKMTDDSAKKFVDMLIKSKHHSVLEHGTVYLYVEYIEKEYWAYHIQDYVENPYSKVYIDREGMDDSDLYFGYVTTNLRVLQENNWLDDLQYLCEPTEFHEKRLSVKVVTSRGISHELVRHRSMSFIQESQRYVGYTKDKFGGEITYIIPSWSSLPLGTVLLLPKNSQESVFCIRQENIDSPVVIPDKNGNLEFLEVCAASEREYRCLINHGFKPQEAREILPNATKTTLVITAFESDWREWFSQRLFGKTGAPHPDMLVLANLIKEEFEKAGVWEGVMKYPSKYD